MFTLALRCVPNWTIGQLQVGVVIFNGCDSRQDLDFVIERMTFFSSEGASASGGSKPGLIRLFQKNYLWISFIWCFSHRLELAIKDALKEFLEPVETALRHLYYLYTKSTKKYGELKSL